MGDAINVPCRSSLWRLQKIPRRLSHIDFAALLARLKSRALPQSGQQLLSGLASARTAYCVSRKTMNSGSMRARIKSLRAMMPTSLPSAVTGTRTILCSWRLFMTSSSGVFASTVTAGPVIT